ncbi:hypothetical protein Tco_0426947, partial [Tanacetum coccineum]
MSFEYKRPMLMESLRYRKIRLTAVRCFSVGFASAQDMEILVKKCLMPLALKTQDDSLAFIHEDELDELESDKAEFSNMYDMLLQECVAKDVM